MQHVLNAILRTNAFFLRTQRQVQMFGYDPYNSTAAFCIYWRVSRAK